MTTNKYQSGEYYKKTYVIENLDLDKSTKWMNNYYQTIIDLFPQIQKLKTKKILEIGCGYGGFINILNKNSFTNVTASDTSDLIYLKKNLKNEFIIINLEDGLFKTDKYDIIFAFDVMEHINNTDKAVENIKSMLTDDGIFIFCVPYPIRKHLLDKYHTNMQYPNYYTNIFYRNDFKLIALENITFIPFIWQLGLPIHIKRIIKNDKFITETFFIFKK